jgi:ribonucleotide monophosphatase NagD (HAD superfamily)
VATNGDSADRHGAIMLPGNGCAVAAVERSVGAQAIDTGKPSAWMGSLVTSLLGVDPRRTVVFGGV